MPGTRRAYFNDNIRTEHLKCSSCRTQVYLIKIELDDAGGETRVFSCPHCSSLRALHIERHIVRREAIDLTLVGDRTIC
jgi:DNA-directed RNA polymerase subunit RPC12/RpoP